MGTKKKKRKKTSQLKFGPDRKFKERLERQSISLTAGQMEWCKKQGNASKYIRNLILKDKKARKK